MNHRTLFFLSITAIAVGVTGIFLQQKGEAPEPKQQVTVENVSRTILVAEAIHDLQAGEILSPQDYKIATLKASSTISDPRDISSIPGGNLRGYLVTETIKKGSGITLPMLLSPTHPDYAKRSLRVNEMPYAFPVSAPEDYLLSSTRAGDKLALYIRIKEIERGKTEMVGLASEGSSSYRAQTPKYVVTRIFEQVTVLDSKRFFSAREGENAYSTNNKIVGTIVLRLNQKQLAMLRTIETSGQLFLLPDSQDKQSIKRISMDEVLPQLRSIKELRGSR